MSEFDECVNQSSTAYMLASTILVLGMIPGLGFFEVGLLPHGMTTSVLSQIMTLLPILSVLWFVFGYSLSFSSGSSTAGIHAVIGGFDHAAFRGVSVTGCNDFAPEIPEQLFATFEMMFACITPLLMTGAFAGRMRFSAMVLFTIAWEILVYYPCCYMMWGGGWLQRLGALDFAGGIVVHTTAGAGALVAAWWVGPRPEFAKATAEKGGDGEVPPSNVAMACVGMALLWCGWFGFNGGSAFAISPVAVAAIVNTQVAAAVSGAVWVCLSKLERGYTSLVPAVNGSLAGLAGITPAAGYVGAGSAAALGLVLGAVCYGGVCVLKRGLRIDDALDVSVVHGLSGIVGSLAVGVCASTAVNGGLALDGAAHGGGWRLLRLQSAAVAVVAAWSAVVSLAILFVVDRAVGVAHAPADVHVTPARDSSSSSSSGGAGGDSNSEGDVSLSADPAMPMPKQAAAAADFVCIDVHDHRNSRAYRLS